MRVKRYISLSEMETITEDILSQYGYPLNFDCNFQPVPIDEIIEFHYEIDISWEMIDHFAQDSRVMAAIIPKLKKIIMNDSCKELFEEKIGTMNFTMAHELGHWVLHVHDKLNQQVSLVFEEDKEVYYCRSFSKKPPEEIQADLFAGCLLMPKPIIVPLVNQLKEKYKEIKFPQLYRIADMFQVSISALKVRLVSLNLLYIDQSGKIHNSKDDSYGQITLNI